MVDSREAREGVSSCPFIVLADGAVSASASADPDRWCRAGTEPVPIALSHQSAFCLSDRHVLCERYVARRHPTDVQTAPAERAAEPPGYWLASEELGVASVSDAATGPAPDPPAAIGPGDPEPVGVAPVVPPEVPATMPEEPGAEVKLAATAEVAATAVEPGAEVDVAPTAETEPGAEPAPAAETEPGAEVEVAPTAETEPGAEPAPAPATPRAAPVSPLALGITAGLPGRAAPDHHLDTPRTGRSTGTWLAIVLVLLLVAGAAGYGLAFLSSELVGRGGGPAVAAASLLPGSPPAAPSPAVGATGSSGASATAVLSTPATAAPSRTPRPSRSARPSASPATTSGTATRTHVVRPGETLFSIATRYGLTVRQLAAANNIVDVNTIYAGQTLVIPTP